MNNSPEITYEKDISRLFRAVRFVYSKELTLHHEDFDYIKTKGYYIITENHTLKKPTNESTLNNKYVGYTRGGGGIGIDKEDVVATSELKVDEISKSSPRPPPKKKHHFWRITNEMQADSIYRKKFHVIAREMCKIAQNDDKYIEMFKLIKVFNIFPFNLANTEFCEDILFKYTGFEAKLKLTLKEKTDIRLFVFIHSLMVNYKKSHSKKIKKYCKLVNFFFQKSIEKTEIMNHFYGKSSSSKTLQYFKQFYGERKFNNELPVLGEEFSEVTEWLLQESRTSPNIEQENPSFHNINATWSDSPIFLKTSEDSIIQENLMAIELELVKSKFLSNNEKFLLLVKMIEKKGKDFYEYVEYIDSLLYLILVLDSYCDQLISKTNIWNLITSVSELRELVVLSGSSFSATLNVCNILQSIVLISLCTSEFNSLNCTLLNFSSQELLYRICHFLNSNLRPQSPNCSESLETLEFRVSLKFINNAKNGEKMELDEFCNLIGEF